MHLFIGHRGLASLLPPFLIENKVEVIMSNSQSTYFCSAVECTEFLFFCINQYTKYPEAKFLCLRHLIEIHCYKYELTEVMSFS